MELELDKRINQHLNVISGQIGARPAGSRANHDAAEYIQKTFQAYGLEIEVQEYACPAWEDWGTALTIQGQPLNAAANPFSPPCNVNAPFIMVGTLDELDAADLEQRIGVLYGDLTKDVLACKSWFLKSKRDERIIHLLEEKKPLAIIAVQTKAGMLNRLIEDWELPIPSVTVPEQTGFSLLEHPEATLHLHIQSRQFPSHSANIVARKAGKNKTEIVLCAHYDTKVDTPGAIDNGTGVAALLTLAEALQQRKLMHQIEFIAFSNEEYLPIGEDEYIPRRGERFESIIAAINFDGIGHSLGTDTLMITAHSQSFYTLVDGLKQKYPTIAWTEPWPESNHSSFSMRGVPSLAFMSTEARRVAHMRSDTLQMASPTKVAEVVCLAIVIMESIQNKNELWTRGRNFP